MEGASVSPSSVDGRVTARALYGENQETRTVPLAGAQGLTAEDQEAIDRATDAGCAVGALSQRECDRASDASGDRRRDLAREAASTS